MKGLELSRRFFLEWALPVLREATPDLVAQIAAGLTTCNSQVLGYDDELSRDHAWGPFFIIWVPDDMDHNRIRTIEQALQRALPKEFLGFPLSAHRSIPFEMGDFAVVKISEARKFVTGFEAGPRTDLDWLTIPEHRLCEATAGELFHDPSALMESWRKEIAYFPGNVWLKRLSFTWLMLGVTAQMRRCVNRQDAIGGHMWVSWFLEASMRLGFLLCRRYAPWRKWLFRRLTETWPHDSTILEHLQELASITNLKKQEALMLEILETLGHRSNELGVVDVRPLRQRHMIDNFTPFNYEGFVRAFHGLLKPPLAGLPLDSGPVDMWGSLQAFTASPPCFMGNATFIEAVYGR